MSCECSVPRERADPRFSSCAACGHRISDELRNPDRQLRGFFDQLEDGIRGQSPKRPPGFIAFRRHCEARERAGREEFGLGYLSRDNCIEALEEGADLAIYMVLDAVRHEHLYGEDADRALALSAALDAFRAYEKVRELAAKRRGTP